VSAKCSPIAARQTRHDSHAVGPDRVKISPMLKTELRSAQATTVVRDGARMVSFERGLAVLFAIVERDDVRIDEIAEQLRMPRSTIYRYVQSLRISGLVSEHEGRYHRGSRAAFVAGVRPDDARLASVAGPILRDLVRLTGETSLVLVRSGLAALSVRQVESPHRLRMAFRPDEVLPLHAGAGSRALLAFAPASITERIISGETIRYTPATPHGDALRRELERVRRIGYAISRGEFTPGAIAIAIPVFVLGEVACSIVVAGPARRCGTAWQIAAREALRHGADRLSAVLRSG
jgi:DNA-binding IclR family transcriptional regulator